MLYRVRSSGPDFRSCRKSGPSVRSGPDFRDNQITVTTGRERERVIRPLLYARQIRPALLTTMSQAVTRNLLARELCKVDQWDVLGIYLGLEESEIKVIERDHHDTARRRIVMLNQWMEKDVDAPWEKVIDSLEIMSQTSLANQLKEKYISQESNPPAASPRDTPAIEMVVNRQESTIAQEIQNFELKYIELVTKIETAMEKAKPSPIKLKRFTKYFYENAEVTTVEELFDQLEPFCFLDYALLEQIVKFFLSQDAVADNLHDYLQELAKFKSSITVKQFMDSIEQAQQSVSKTSERPGLCTVKLRLVGGWLDKTMDDLEKLVKEIFKDKAYVLSHLKIVRGSVIVTYSAPLSEVDPLIMFALEQSLFVTKVGVIELIVGDIMIAQSDSLDYSFESSLFGAMKDNDINLMSFLLNIHTSADAANDEGMTALMHAVYYNRVEALSLLLKANANPNIQMDDGSTPLLVATQNGHTDIVSLLLKANANINSQRDDSFSPLYIASLQGLTEIVSLLLKANADTNLRKDNGATPLHIASQRAHIEVVALLLKANVNPNSQMNNGFTPIHAASQLGHTDIVSLLLKANANPNSQEEDGLTPLLVATHNGHTDTVSLLLKANANINLQANNGVTSLYVASHQGHTDIVSLLLKANANPNIQMDDGATPLSIATQEGHTEIVSLLLKANVDINLQKDDGVTPLLIASHQGHIDIVSLLLKSNANPNIQNKNGSSPLFTASSKGHTEVVALLLKANVNPNQTILNGITPILLATQNGYTDIVSLLLKANANPDGQMNYNATPLCIASHYGHTDIVSLLLKANANPDRQMNNGTTTPLSIASRNGHTDIVSLLLKANANPNLLLKGNDLKPLMLAAFEGHSQVVQLLLSSGADPNLQASSHSFTTLMTACHNGSLDSVELLLMFGADPSIVGPQGKTVLDMAAYLNLEDIVDLLQAVKLSQSSTTSQPVLSANEIASNVDNETMALINRAMEQMLVKKTETLITAEYQKHKEFLPFKHYSEGPRNIL